MSHADSRIFEYYNDYYDFIKEKYVSQMKNKNTANRIVKNTSVILKIQ
jgi:hypothetical protein